MTLTIHINRRFILTALTAVVVCLMLSMFWQVRASESDRTTNPTPCPPAVEPHITPASVLRLEHGYMIWFGDTSTVYVMYDAPGTAINGTFETFTDSWKDGMQETDPGIKAPEGLFQPTRGFNKIWRENQRVRDGLGWGLSASSGYMAVFSKQGNKIWFNGHDNAFALVDNHWEDIYAWRK